MSMAAGENGDGAGAGIAQDHAPAASNIFGSLLLIYGVSVLDVALSLIVNLLVPMTATKAAFADYRKLVLYSSYAGLTHLGLLSGLYLSVVGRTTDRLDWDLLRVTKSTLWLLQGVLFCLMAVGLLVFSDSRTLWIGAISVGCWGALNLNTFYNYLFQGTNNFKPFFVVNGVVKVATIVAMAILVLAGAASARNLILAFVIPVAATVLLYEFAWRRLCPAGPRSSISARWPDVLHLWREGFILHAANLCLMLAFTVVSLAVSVLFPAEQFADFAFASGMVTVLYFGVDGLTAVATPSLARMIRSGGRRDASYVVYASLVWIIPAAYWASVIVIRRFVPNYVEAIPVLLVLCTALPMSLLVRSRTAAVATARGRQRAFLGFTLWSLGCTSAFVIVAYLGYGTVYSMAAAWSLAMIGIGCSRAFASDRESDWANQSERRLILDAAGATALFAVCAHGGSDLRFAVLYLVCAGAVVGLRLRGWFAGRAGTAGSQ
jgi:hypothetical protein